MMTARRRVLITYPPSLEERDAFDETLGVLADIGYLPQIAEGERAGALASANIVLARHISKELRPAELALLNSASLIQLLPAGADDIPYSHLPADVPVAVNAGAYAEPIAEHVLALALALAKRLLPNDAALARGEYDHHTPTRDICGSLAAILGFGGIGRASAKLFRALGARIYAIGRSAPAGELADRTGTLADLDTVLAAADILVIALPLTTATRGLIGRRELSLMKPDAILINIARAAIVDEDSLYEHLRRNPSFSAGIDVWWQEPHGTGRFAPRHPFLDLPNVLGSPHNSAITTGSHAAPAQHAAENVARHLRGEPVRNIVDRTEYMDREGPGAVGRIERDRSWFGPGPVARRPANSPGPIKLAWRA